MEWRRWSSEYPADSGDSLSRKAWLSTLEPFLVSFKPASSRLCALLAEEGGSVGGGDKELKLKSRGHGRV